MNFLKEKKYKSWWSGSIQSFSSWQNGTRVNDPVAFDHIAVDKMVQE